MSIFKFTQLYGCQTVKVENCYKIQGIFGKLNFEIEASSSIKMSIFKLSLYFLFAYLATAEKFCKTEGINREFYSN